MKVWIWKQSKNPFYFTHWNLKQRIAAWCRGWTLIIEGLLAVVTFGSVGSDLSINWTGRILRGNRSKGK